MNRRSVPDPPDVRSDLTRASGRAGQIDDHTTTDACSDTSTCGGLRRREGVAKVDESVGRDGPGRRTRHEAAEAGSCAWLPRPPRNEPYALGLTGPSRNPAGTTHVDGYSVPETGWHSELRPSWPLSCPPELLAHCAVVLTPVHLASVHGVAEARVKTLLGPVGAISSESRKAQSRRIRHDWHPASTWCERPFRRGYERVSLARIRLRVPKPHFGAEIHRSWPSVISAVHRPSKRWFPRRVDRKSDRRVARFGQRWSWLSK